MRYSLVATPRKQASDENILVNLFPVKAGSAEFDLRTLIGRGAKQARN